MAARKKKMLEILAERFRFLLGRAHKGGCVGSRAGWGGSGVRIGGARRHTGTRRAGSPWHGCEGGGRMKGGHPPSVNYLWARSRLVPRGMLIVKGVPLADHACQSFACDCYVLPR